MTYDWHQLARPKREHPKIRRPVHRVVVEVRPLRGGQFLAEYKDFDLSAHASTVEKAVDMLSVLVQLYHAHPGVPRLERHVQLVVMDTITGTWKARPFFMDPRQISLSA